MLLGDINRTGNVRKSKLQARKILTILISDRGKEQVATSSESFNETNQTNKQTTKPALLYLPSQIRFPVVTKLSRTSNFIGYCWHKALLF